MFSLTEKVDCFQEEFGKAMFTITCCLATDRTQQKNKQKKNNPTQHVVTLLCWIVFHLSSDKTLEDSPAASCDEAKLL